MTAQELRIGNYVQDLVGAPCRVRAINEGGISIKCGGYSASVEMFKPIELTEEVLLKCGFMKNASNDYVILDLFKLSLHYSYGKPVGWMFFIKSLDWIIVNRQNSIKYFHQLQNLYFALTNKELEICF